MSFLFLEQTNLVTFTYNGHDVSSQVYQVCNGSGRQRLSVANICTTETFMHCQVLPQYLYNFYNTNTNPTSLCVENGQSAIFCQHRHISLYV